MARQRVGRAIVQEPRAREQPASPLSPTRRRVFASLRHRNYFLLWVGSLISNTGDWMDQVALNWLVWGLTHDPLHLAVLNACRALPILAFTLFGGALADRVERRRLMQSTQTFAMLLAFALAILVQTGLVQLWQVFTIGALRGVMMSFNQPTRQALISELVPRQDLMNAVALNSATLNMTRVFGGSLGGLLIGLVGVAGCFYLNGLSFIAVIGALALMEIPARPAVRRQASIVRSVGEGLGYIRSQPALAGLVLAGLVPMVFGMPYMSLLPIFADAVLHISNEGYGFMVALSGAGALVGSLAVASLGDFQRKGRLMLAVMTGFGAMLILFSLSHWPPLSLLLLLGVGCGSTTYIAVNNTLLQVNASDEMRGRVLSVFFLNRGLVPLGTMLAGLTARFVGAPLTVSIMGAVVVVLALTLMIRVPVVRELA
jgi:MFS transporter, DHA1 family, staphyloferrin A biosynthesis exporter